MQNPPAMINERDDRILRPTVILGLDVKNIVPDRHIRIESQAHLPDNPSSKFCCTIRDEKISPVFIDSENAASIL